MKLDIKSIVIIITILIFGFIFIYRFRLIEGAKSRFKRTSKSSKSKSSPPSKSSKSKSSKSKSSKSKSSKSNIKLQNELKQIKLDLAASQRGELKCIKSMEAAKYKTRTILKKTNNLNSGILTLLFNNTPLKI